mmetsp:Transcript_12669/g.18476  ORF Transcript_12669/g.18476 Transcript_12669/m.18476 type:complete len:132 (-) Transcript_12669:279-674(-)|eukprot:CAMPEP_0197242124 /NCGR_PEP_ID=MMETSP1429-20130617/7968_1 /TAXON_ID=49237 /ORGANISM="Chaetoceros  sp., Strain UNC1202" /LENGTH=131 /DNA_ID=CAMNT_0042702087 /DNA_START=137 /DNA_END=532 /DNA_ORIENTATION=+
MATRGIKQLKQLQLVFCEHGGSSRSIREYISTGRIVQFATDNPTVEVEAKLRNGKHPYVKAEYMTGYSKQVCIKNESMDRIEKVVTLLNNSSGRKITKIGAPIKTDTPSVQGVWTPMLDIADSPFKVEFKE